MPQIYAKPSIDGAHVSLFTMGGMYSDLKELLNREIDLVEEGTLYIRHKLTKYAVFAMHG